MDQSRGSLHVSSAWFLGLTPPLRLLSRRSGKSTLIKLLSKELYPDEGQIVVRPGEAVATCMQTMPTACRDLTVKAFFAEQLRDPSVLDHELEAKMARALQEVLLTAPGDRLVRSFSGGQRARLLLPPAALG